MAVRKSDDKIWNEFFEKSSIHGMNYLVGQSTNRFQRWISYKNDQDFKFFCPSESFGRCCCWLSLACLLFRLTRSRPSFSRIKWSSEMRKDSSTLAKSCILRWQSVWNLKLMERTFQKSNLNDILVFFLLYSLFVHFVIEKGSITCLTTWIIKKWSITIWTHSWLSCESIRSLSGSRVA